ncbi:MAG: hypothetical protein WAL29_15910 [Bacteroidales bacterium]
MIGFLYGLFDIHPVNNGSITFWSIRATNKLISTHKKYFVVPYDNIFVTMEAMFFVGQLKITVEWMILLKVFLFVFDDNFFHSSEDLSVLSIDIVFY